MATSDSRVDGFETCGLNSTALTYCYEKQSGLDAQIRQGLEELDQLATEVSDAGFRRKLNDLKRSL